MKAILKDKKMIDSQAEREYNDIHNGREANRVKLFLQTKQSCLAAGMTEAEAHCKACKVNDEYVAETQRLSAHLIPTIEEEFNTVLIAESNLVTGRGGDYSSMWTMPLIKKYLRKYSKGAGKVAFGKAKNRYTAADIAKAKAECLASEPTDGDGLYRNFHLSFLQSEQRLPLKKEYDVFRQNMLALSEETV